MAGRHTDLRLQDGSSVVDRCSHLSETHRDELHLVGVSGDVASSEDAANLAEEWREAAPVHLEIIESPYRDLGGPLATAVHDITAADTHAICLLVVPEIVVAKWRFLHNQRTALIRRALVDQERAVLVTVPYAIS